MKKHRNPADIVMDVTVNLMAVDDPSIPYIHFGFNAEREHVISGNDPGHEPTAVGTNGEGKPGIDWSVTIHANGTQTAVGSVPASVAQYL